jgi:signal transduction histidine kinase
MRQIIHELRTPLNAILGFAEIIEQQLFGPAGVHYREMAGNILVDARRLLAAFDDIDLAARSAADEAGHGEKRVPDAVDVEALIGRLLEMYDSAQPGGAADGRSRLRISLSSQVPQAYADPVQCERMIQHLARTLVSVAEPGEVVQGAVWFQPNAQGGGLIVGFDRPVRLRGLDEAELFDPGYGSDGDWPDGPFLGLGFSLRLVRSLAQAQGGGLRIEAERILLDLPVAGAVANGETA